MIFDHVSIGGGVIGLTINETIITNIIKNLNKSKSLKKNIFNLAIIEKEIGNIPGGIAYGFKNSLHGYFNNPLRLAPIEFVKFIKNNVQIKLNIINYLSKYGGVTDKNWVKENKNILMNPNCPEFKEIYLPRISLAYWLQFKFETLINNINLSYKKGIFVNIFFLKGQVNDIIEINKSYMEIVADNQLFTYQTFSFISNNKSNKIVFNNTNKKIKKIYTLNSTIGIGIPPPTILGNYKLLKHKNYLWDFYSEGSTNSLISKIKQNPKKIIRVFFIGYKAGLLEALPELNELIQNSQKNIKLFCLSPTMESLQKAELSNKKYKLIYFKKSNLNNFNKANDIYESILKEFLLGTNKGFLKYDIWTCILQKKIIDLAIKKLSNFEKKKYNLTYFPKIRSLTRYTYSYPIEVKDKMIKNKKLILIQTKVKNIIVNNHNFKISTIKEFYNADIVVNVSGPLSVNKIENEIKLVKNLKLHGISYNQSGILVDKFYQIKNFKNLYSPGIISSGFNPERKTIINAIINNSIVAGNNIYERINFFYNKKNFYKAQIECFKKILLYEINNVKKIGGLAAPKSFFHNNRLIFSESKNTNFTKDNCIKTNNFKIVIDGKAGSGKSTMSEYISSIYNIVSIDTGYILKAFSKKILDMQLIHNNLNNSDIESIFDSIGFDEICNRRLDDIKYREITKEISLNVLIRKFFNKKILYFSNILNAYILTGRDTGVAVFKKDKSVNKIFLDVSDLIAAKRKSINKNFKMSLKETIDRNISDKKNILSTNESIIIDNNNNNKYKALSNILNFLK